MRLDPSRTLRGAFGLLLLVGVTTLVFAPVPGCGGVTDDCPKGLKDCGDYCSDTSLDPQNCGGCGKKCGKGQVCNDSACVVPCAFPNDQRCSGVCVRFEDDPQNCGSCHNVCDVSQQCFASDCIAK